MATLSGDGGRHREGEGEMNKAIGWILIALISIFYGSTCIIAYGVIAAVVEDTGLSGIYLYAIMGLVASFFLLFLVVAIEAVAQ